ncbi:MAG: hypothetical protein HRU00_17390 [Myxococcales bacterium]|nr:hypothetical protein [Myxococcales bacterium]
MGPVRVEDVVEATKRGLDWYVLLENRTTRKAFYKAEGGGGLNGKNRISYGATGSKGIFKNDVSLTYVVKKLHEKLGGHYKHVASTEPLAAILAKRARPQTREERLAELSKLNRGTLRILCAQLKAKPKGQNGKWEMVDALMDVFDDNAPKSSARVRRSTMAKTREHRSSPIFSELSPRDQRVAELRGMAERILRKMARLVGAETVGLSKEGIIEVLMDGVKRPLRDRLAGTTMRESTKEGLYTTAAREGWDLHDVEESFIDIWDSRRVNLYTDQQGRLWVVAIPREDGQKPLFGLVH